MDIMREKARVADVPVAEYARKVLEQLLHPGVTGPATKIPGSASATDLILKPLEVRTPEVRTNEIRPDDPHGEPEPSIEDFKSSPADLAAAERLKKSLASPVKPGRIFGQSQAERDKKLESLKELQKQHQKS